MSKRTERVIPPSGLFIDSPSNKWMIGERLGSGACGAVYALQKVNSKSSTSSNNFVIKVTPLPKGNLSSKSNKKKKKTDIEKNADLLYFENTLYRNVFNDLRGVDIPDIPIVGYNSGPIGYGEITDNDCGGYRFLVMERMQYPFHYMVPLIFNSYDAHHNHNSNSNSNNRIKKNSKSTKWNSIPIGIIASRLIDLIQKIHDTQRLFVDVKAENFMLAKHSTSSKPVMSSKTMTMTTTIATLMNQIANRIRMIDFGLVENIKDASTNKHRIDNYPNSQIVGTPIYASLNVLSGHTVSRRDDLESVGYVIVELILQIIDYDQKRRSIMLNKSKSSSKKCTQHQLNNLDTHDNDDGITNDKVQHVDLNILPWCNNGATSDDEIFAMKKNAMKTKNGSLWKMLLGYHNHDDEEDKDDNDTSSIVVDHVSDVMKEYFDIVMKLEYREKPDYDHLKAVVSRLNVQVTGMNNTMSSTKSTYQLPATNSSTQQKKKKPSTSSTTTKRTTRNIVKNETIDIHSSSSDNDVVTCTHPDKDNNIIDISLPDPSHKRKTRTSRKAAESEGMLPPSINGAIGNVKARKKRILKKTTITTTETVEIVEGDDSDDEQEATFLDAKEKMDDNNDDVSDEEMLSVDDGGVDNDDNDNQNDNNESVDVSFLSCNSMDWETFTNDENRASSVNQSTNVSRDGVINVVGGLKQQQSQPPSSQEYSLTLECIEGCHKGIFLNLSGELIIGKNPNKRFRGKKGKDTFQINDVNASDVHAKLILNKSGKKKVLLTVRVSDMKSDIGTFVNGKKVIGSGKQAFVNDKIKIGDCVFCIRQA